MGRNKGNRREQASKRSRDLEPNRRISGGYGMGYGAAGFWNMGMGLGWNAQNPDGCLSSAQFSGGTMAGGVTSADSGAVAGGDAGGGTATM